LLERDPEKPFSRPREAPATTVRADLSFGGRRQVRNGHARWNAVTAAPDLWRARI